MFDIPYSDGILPGVIPAGGMALLQSSMMLFPTAANGSAVDVSGSLVSFLPPVDDWYTPVDDWYTPAVQTSAPAMRQAQHPCQGGGECGCGGTCKSQSGIQTSTQAPAASEQNSYRDLSADPLSDEEVQELDKLYGNTFIAGNPSGNGVIVTADQSGNEMFIRIRKIADASILFEKKLLKDANGWSTGEKIIQGNFPKISFGIAAFVNLVAQQQVAANLGQLLSFDVQSGSFIAQPKFRSEPNAVSMASSGIGDSVLQTETPMSPCIKYDLVCTMPFIESDGKHLSLWMLPIGNFQVDIGGCCHAHDIAWWCAKHPVDILGNGDDVVGANGDVIDCISSQIVNAILAACSNTLSCTGFFSWLCDAAVVACDLLASPFAAAYLLAVDLGGWLGTTYVALEQETDLFNFDGSHSNSCLCGGNEVTYQCPGPIDEVAGNEIYGNSCRNVCLEVGSTIGAVPDCFQCYYECKYDEYGNLIANPKVVNDPNKPCCPGSASTTSPYDDAPCATCAATNCSNCRWLCESYKIGKHTKPQWYWRSISDDESKPCCMGTPGGKPSSGCPPCVKCTWKYELVVRNFHRKWEWVNSKPVDRECCPGTPGPKPR